MPRFIARDIFSVIAAIATVLAGWSLALIVIVAYFVSCLYLFSPVVTQVLKPFHLQGIVIVSLSTTMPLACPILALRICIASLVFAYSGISRLAHSAGIRSRFLPSNRTLYKLSNANRLATGMLAIVAVPVAILTTVGLMMAYFLNVVLQTLPQRQYSGLLDVLGEVFIILYFAVLGRWFIVLFVLFSTIGILIVILKIPSVRRFRNAMLFSGRFQELAAYRSHLQHSAARGQASLASGTTDASTLLELATTYTSLGCFADARDTLVRLLDCAVLEPNKHITFIAYERLITNELLLGNKKAARGLCRKWADAMKGLPDDMATRIRLELQQARVGAAMLDLQYLQNRLHKLEGAEVRSGRLQQDVLCEMAKLCVVTGRSQEAQDYLERAKNISPTDDPPANPVLSLELGQLQERLGNLQDALFLYLDAIALAWQTKELGLYKAGLEARARACAFLVDAKYRGIVRRLTGNPFTFLAIIVRVGALAVTARDLRRGFQIAAPLSTLVKLAEVTLSTKDISSESTLKLHNSTTIAMVYQLVRYMLLATFSYLEAEVVRKTFESNRYAPDSAPLFALLNYPAFKMMTGIGDKSAFEYGSLYFPRNYQLTAQSQIIEARANLLWTVEASVLTLRSSSVRRAAFGADRLYYSRYVEREVRNPQLAFQVWDRYLTLSASGGFSYARYRNVLGTSDDGRTDQLRSDLRLRVARLTGATHSDAPAQPSAEMEMRESFARWLNHEASMEKDRAIRAPDLTEIEDNLSQPFPGIQGRLPSGCMFVAYSLGEKRSLAWVITADTFDAVDISERDPILSAVGWFMGCVGKQPSAGDESLEWVSAANALGFLLIAPLRKLLTGRKIIFALDKDLQGLPFAALSLSPIDANSSANENYYPLIQDFEVTYVPSAAFVDESESNCTEPEPTGKCVIVADPIYSLADERITSAGSKLTDGNWARLASSAGEAEAVAKALASYERILLLGDDADANKVLTFAKTCDILHLATHSFYRKTIPPLNCLMLSQYDRSGGSCQSCLTGLDVQYLAPTAKLVVLSACESGLISKSPSPGMPGLAEAFLLGGSQRVLGTLWKVADQATSEFIRLFYERSRVGKLFDAAKGLGLAQNELRQSTKWRSPYFWAAFVLSGRSTPFALFSGPPVKDGDREKVVSPQADCRIGSTSEIDDGVTEIPFSNSDDKVNVPSHPSPDGEDIPIDFVDMVHQCSSSDALRGLIDELDDVVRRNSLPPRELAKVFFALAKAHSALEDYDGLASHLIKAASYCRESLQVAENLLLEHSRGTVEDDAQGLLTNLNRRLGIY